ncbi:MAG: hypothetical protein ACLQO7_00490 [Candidatus Bathyarchaeia archaeon]
MTLDQKLTHRINLLVHSVGLSCLGGAIFLQILVFSTILLQGYFRAVETNPAILALEISLTAFSAVYFLYLYQKVIRTSMS